MEINTISLGDCLELMQGVPDGAIDAIVTDPPYQYLKNTKLDRPFDEARFFEHARRVLKADGFIVLFGRGTAFYRWNTTLADLGFKFKEEIVWDKLRITSPLMAILRVHETISIFGNGSKSRINRVKVPYVDMRKHNIGDIVTDIKRLKVAFGNTSVMNHILEYLKTGKSTPMNYKGANYLTTSSAIENIDRSTSVIMSMDKGMNEKSIVRLCGDRYRSIHPTQKPVRLMERLLALVSSEGDLILDPFAGSGSTAVACINTGRDFIGMELDREYCDGARARVAAAMAEKTAQKASVQKMIDF